MDIVQTLFLILLGIALVGSILQSFGPFKAFFSSKLDPFLMNFTQGIVGLIIATVLMVTLVRSSRNREGFQDSPSPFKQLQSKLKIPFFAEEVCRMARDAEQSIYEDIKGAGPEQISEAEARKETQAFLQKEFPEGVLSCEPMEALLKPDVTEDQAFEMLANIPDNLLVRMYTMAFFVKEKAKEMLDKMKESLDVRTTPPQPSVFEGFKDLCSPEVAEARRKFLREQKLTQAQEQCLLPEEVPVAEKNKVFEQKLDAMQKAYDAYIAKISIMGQRPPTMVEIMKEYYPIKAELERFKKKAESGTLQEELKA